MLGDFQTLSTFVASIDQEFTWRIDISSNWDLIFLVGSNAGFGDTDSSYFLGTLAPNVDYVVEIVVSPGLPVFEAFINGVLTPVSSALVRGFGERKEDSTLVLLLFLICTILNSNRFFSCLLIAIMIHMNVYLRQHNKAALELYRA